jgi:hypothetical protein
MPRTREWALSMALMTTIRPVPSLRARITTVSRRPDARWQEIREDCKWCQCVLIRINPNGPQTMLTKTMRSGNAVWGAHSAANQAAFHGVMDAVAAKVQAEIVPYIEGSDGPRELKIDHKKVSDAFNFHEDEKAQYQPDYMEGAYIP